MHCMLTDEIIPESPVDAPSSTSGHDRVSSLGRQLPLESDEPPPLSREQARRSVLAADLVYLADNPSEGLSHIQKRAAIRRFRGRKHALSKISTKPVRPLSCPPDSIIFDRNEFSRLNNLYGPVTLDACASSFDSVCPNFCSAENPFTNASVTGETVFINPVYDESALPILEHFESQRQSSPYDTRAIIVLPRWASAIGKSWLPILKKYKRIHSYPAGTYLFHTATSATETLPMPATY